MTHEKKIKALIEAGEKATGGKWRAIPFGDVRDDEGRMILTAGFGQNEVFAAQAANARDSINLLAEIAEAAVELQTADCAGSAASDRAWAKLDALLAKYKEAGNE